MKKRSRRFLSHSIFNNNSSSRLSSHNKDHQKKQQKSSNATSTLLKKLSEPHQHERLHQQQQQNEEFESSPLRHTNNGYANPVIHTHKPTTLNCYKQSVNDCAKTNNYEPQTTAVEKPKRRNMQHILNKRRSIDSDGLKKLQQNNDEQNLNESRLKLKRHSMLSINEHQPVLSTKSKLPTSKVPTITSKASIAQRRNSNLQQPAVTNATVQRRNSNSQQPSVNNINLQRRNSNLQQSIVPSTTGQRRNSNLQQPIVTATAVQKRNSHLQQKQQSDRRRWSSYAPHHQDNETSGDQLPQISQQCINNNTIEHVSPRQGPKKVLNRHSMIVPTSRRLSHDNLHEDMLASNNIRRNVSYEEDVQEIQPPLHSNILSSEKVRRRHTLTASDKRVSMGQLSRQTEDKRASLYRANYTQTIPIDENHNQVEIEQQVQRRHTLTSGRSAHIRTSSYERSTEEPNRYRSKLRNPTKENQLSSTLRNTHLNSKHISPREYQQHTRSIINNDSRPQFDIDEVDHYRHNLPDVTLNQEYEYEQQADEQIVPPLRYSSRKNVEQHQSLLSNTTQQLRNRAISAPSSQQRTNDNYYADKPSLMPVPTRYRKHSNNSISKYASVPENEGLSSFSPPKDVRFGPSTTNTYPEEIQVEASRSSGGLSNSTTSSSYSSERYYDPPTPPTSAVITHQHSKRKSMPVMNASMIDEQVRKTENRYSSYLARVKKENAIPEFEENSASRRLLPRRQRVVSEDNENYKQQLDQRQISQQVYRDDDTEDVISSAKRLLSIVKERRSRLH